MVSLRYVLPSVSRAVLRLAGFQFTPNITQGGVPLSGQLNWCFSSGEWPPFCDSDLGNVEARLAPASYDPRSPPQALSERPCVS